MIAPAPPASRARTYFRRHGWRVVFTADTLGVCGLLPGFVGVSLTSLWPGLQPLWVGVSVLLGLALLILLVLKDPVAYVSVSDKALTFSRPSLVLWRREVTLPLIDITRATEFTESYKWASALFLQITARDGTVYRFDRELFNQGADYDAFRAGIFKALEDQP